MIIYCDTEAKDRCMPQPASRLREWWETNNTLRQHAKYCLPLLMANGLGWYIPSPATFDVSWDGKSESYAQIDVKTCPPHASVTPLVTYGSFAVSLGMVIRTPQPGQFIYVKGIPNCRCDRFTCMEALIEAWWNPSPFSVVCLLTQSGSFTIRQDEPLAQLFVYQTCDDDSSSPTIRRGFPPEYYQWQARRYRGDYRRDLDYMRGRMPDGSTVHTHFFSWTNVRKGRSSRRKAR